MDATITSLVLLAAILHASWNALIKADHNQHLATVLLTISSGVISLGLIAFFPFPPLVSWPYLGASAVIHVLYFWFLSIAYRWGDLSLVYPIARGTAPLIVAIIMFFFVGEKLSVKTLLAIFVIVGGILGLSLRNGWRQFQDWQAVLYSLATALMIASYTIIDGLGARFAGNAHGYTVSMFALTGIIYAAVFGWRTRQDLKILSRRQWAAGIGAGIISLTSYWIIIWSMTLAPIAPVSALRETSVIFAALIGSLVLKEVLGGWRMICVIIVALGVVLLRI